MSRKLVTIRTISALLSIPDADAIEAAVVDGWTCVVKKGEMKVGQQVLYFEIDSVLPEDNPLFSFLMPKGGKNIPIEGGGTVKGHRLRTIKLRGQRSQGLALPLPKDFDTSIEDLDAHFGVVKYEKPIPVTMAGKMRGNYPEWLPKTDQERVQNCFDKLPDTFYVMEEKLEGSSMTVYWDGTSAGVTSRNVDLALDQEGNTFVNVAKSCGILDAVVRYATERGLSSKFAVRGELIGPGIQDNIYNLHEHDFYIFDVWTEEGGYLTPLERETFLSALTDEAGEQYPAKVVPQLGLVKLSQLSVKRIEALSEGKSTLADTLREGLVFKSSTRIRDRFIRGVVSFKCISPEYLLQEK